LLQRANSKVILKISLLVVIEIGLICGSFFALAYFQSQGTSIGNSINIAGKNRYLTANSLLQTEKYIDGPSNISQLKAALDDLETNIVTLKQGGSIAGIVLKPLPPDFFNRLKNIERDFSAYKSLSENKIIKQGHIVIASAQSTALKKEIELAASNLVMSSDILVTELGVFADRNSQNLMLMQIFLGILNIGILALILYLVSRILRPISALTQATKEVKKGNFGVSVQQKGSDELAVLSESFNSMIYSIKNYIEKQKQLTEELKIVNEELKQKDRLKDEFINIAAHEMRTPVQPILGLSELLKSRRNESGDMPIDKQEEDELLDMIISNAKRLLQLEENILDVTRIENKLLKLDLVKCNLPEIILDAMRAQNHTEKNKVQLQFNPNQESNVLVNADRAKLTQVVSNLLSNAINFTQEGIIEINVQKYDNQAVVTIKDSGSGIDQKIMSKLFSKFATNSSSGTGLGLFISKSIIEVHGGKIWAENNPTGRGATFYFSLPIENK